MFMCTWFIHLCLFSFKNEPSPTQTNTHHKYHIDCIQEWRTMLLKRKLEHNYWQLLLHNTWSPLFIPVFVERRAMLIMSANAKCSLCFWMKLCLVSTVLMKTLSCTLPHTSNTWLWGICLSHPCVAFSLSLCISFFRLFPSLPLSLSFLRLLSLPFHLFPFLLWSLSLCWHQRGA